MPVPRIAAAVKVTVFVVPWSVDSLFMLNAEIDKSATSEISAHETRLNKAETRFIGCSKSV